MLTVDEITSTAQFEAVKTEWNHLLEESGHYSPFLSHEWFQCCLSSFAHEKELFILTVRNGIELIGIAPLWRYSDDVRGIPVRKIGFITSPDTPSVDFVLHKEWQHGILQACLRYLYDERRAIWDVLTLNQWPIDSLSYRIVQKLLQEQGKKGLWNLSSCTPYITVHGEWNAFLGSRSTRFKKTHRNIVNRIRKLSNVEVQCYRQDKSVLNDVLAVSKKSWKHQRGIAIGSCEETKKFFEMLTDLAGQQGWLMVWVLRLSGKPVAMEYDLEYTGNVYALRADFDETYRECSPGAYLEYEIVKRLFEEGYREYHTGPGTNTYKLHWTERVRENVELRVCNDNVKGRMIWTMEGRFFPILRRIRDLKWKSA